MGKLISKLLITIIIFLITIILLKSNIEFKNYFFDNVLNNNLSFTSIATKYETLFGSPIPFKKLIVAPVFDEKINYTSINEYKGGVILEVQSNLIPSIDKGLVIFIGKKDNENCLIVEQEDVEITYCMFENIGVNLYDHVEKGTYLGEVDKKIYLIFKKNGEILNYENFI